MSGLCRGGSRSVQLALARATIVGLVQPSEHDAEWAVTSMASPKLLICPVCHSRSVRTNALAELTLLGACDECFAVFTVQLSRAAQENQARMPPTVPFRAVTRAR